MTPEAPLPAQTHDAIAQRAADYFQRRRFWGWSEADQVELEAWLAEAVTHRVAFLRVEGIVARTEHLATLRPPKGVAKAEEAAPIRKSNPPRRWLMLPLLAAASIALFVILGIPFLQQWMKPPDRVFGTAVGGHALLKFADGTEIELNTDTAVRYRITTEERTVWLEKGEAYFHVAHDAAHPFTVVAGGHRITDLGTEFLVRENMGRLDVALVEGRAQLTSGNTETPVAMLAPGDEAAVTSVSTIITKKSPQELADELAWRRGMLVFRKTPLSEVVKEFNRYNTIKLVIADPSIANVPIVAKLRADDYESFLELAENVLKLRVDREGGTILISRGQPETTNKVVGVKHGD